MNKKESKFSKDRVKGYINCITDETLIKLLGVTKKTISKWKDGSEIPDLKYLMLLGLAYGTSAEDILGSSIFCSDQVIVNYYDELFLIDLSRAKNLVGDSSQFVGIFFKNDIKDVTTTDVLPGRDKYTYYHEGEEIKFNEKLMDIWIKSANNVPKDEWEEEEEEEEYYKEEEFKTPDEYRIAKYNNTIIDQIYDYHSKWGEGNKNSRFFPIPSHSYQYLKARLNNKKLTDDNLKNYRGINKELFKTYWIAIRTTVNRLLFINPAKIDGIRFGDYEDYYNMSDHANTMGSDLYWPSSCLNLRKFKGTGSDAIEEIEKRIEMRKEWIDKLKTGEHKANYYSNYYDEGEEALLIDSINQNLKHDEEDIKKIKDKDGDTLYKYLAENGFRGSTSQQAYNNLHLSLTEGWWTNDDYAQVKDYLDIFDINYNFEYLLHANNLDRSVLDWFITYTNIYLTNGNILTKRMNSFFNEQVCTRLLSLKENENTFLQLSEDNNVDDNHFINTENISMIDIPLSSILTKEPRY